MDMLQTAGTSTTSTTLTDTTKNLGCS
jgi:hypothetical protein